MSEYPEKPSQIKLVVCFYTIPEQPTRINKVLYDPGDSPDLLHWWQRWLARNEKNRSGVPDYFMHEEPETNSGKQNLEASNP